MGNGPIVDWDERPVLALNEAEVEGLLAKRLSDDRRMRLALDVLADLVGVDRANLLEVLRVRADGLAVDHSCLTRSSVPTLVLASL
ncbi:MAG: hypothetical protein J07HN6_01760 [Halonotius sp. J07HN6]|nr:MAG: hypothetical protein J07HN6_01760 [Halonotius sp. J07HN6]ERH05624.1 MAG: hypothetical protein J07HN4v3_01227 [Halonotius sp. J07HN4]